MNILVQLVHPAHYYYYKIVVERLRKDGHRVFIAITTKDILEELVKDAGWEYENVMLISHKGLKIGYFYDMCARNWRILKMCKKNKVDLLTGSSVEISQIGWLLRKPSINIGEDDACIVPKYTNAIAPFLDVRVTPDSCDNGKIEPKSIHYSGFLKLAYLHPNVFSPSESVVKSYGIDVSKPYFLLRFSALKAHHDTGIKGIDDHIADKIIEMLSPFGRILITSERKLEDRFEQYRLHINPLDIHHIMSFAMIYIGDSQSMANEAAMLGVPSLRFNDFVGKKKIGVMEELEHKYGLTCGISPSDPAKLYAKIEEFLSMPNLRDEFQNRRQKMLADKIDVTAFFTWFIENYPESKRIMKENPDYQYRFK